MTRNKEADLASVPGYYVTRRRRKLSLSSAKCLGTSDKFWVLLVRSCVGGGPANQPKGWPGYPTLR